MPRRSRRQRVDDRLAWQNLTITDIIVLTGPQWRYRDESEWAGHRTEPHERMQTYNDFRQAWMQAKDTPSAWPYIYSEKSMIHLPDAGKRPGAWWTFDAPEWPKDDESDFDCLRRLGLLEPWEDLAFVSYRRERGDDFESTDCPKPFDSWQRRRDAWEAFGPDILKSARLYLPWVRSRLIDGLTGGEIDYSKSFIR